MAVFLDASTLGNPAISDQCKAEPIEPSSLLVVGVAREVQKRCSLVIRQGDVAFSVGLH